MTKIRVSILLLTFLVVGLGGYFLSFIGKGYRFDFKSLSFVPRGLMVASSQPQGAQVLVDGELKTATNATIPLTPGTYDITIKREGYLTWQKRLTIEKEVVTQADAYLFPSVPSLSAVTYLGAYSPTSSHDNSKIAYAVPENKENQEKAGLWIMDFVDLPLGFTREPRQITDGDLTIASWIWSPDSRQILLTTPKGVYLLDAGTFTPQSKLTNVTTQKEKILSSWKLEEEKKLKAKSARLPEALQDLLTRKAKDVLFSPDDTKILYTASGSADLAENLIPPLPGSSTQEQVRHIKEGNIYIYDIKEDRNFYIADQSANLKIKVSWFPTSRHVVIAEEGKITVMDYDGTNKQVVYSGPYVAPYGLSMTNPSKLLILTNLGNNSSISNLYTISLR